MTESNMVLHRGARQVTLDELAAVPVPAPTKRWYPLGHAAVLGRVKQTLVEFGYEVRRESLALTRNDARFFGTLDLASELAEGVALSVGVRNSVDQSLPLGFCAGSRVFVCDNLAFSAELLVRRKHTRFGEQRFGEDIAAAVERLGGHLEIERSRIARMQSTTVPGDVAESYILRAFERGIVPPRHLAAAIREWRHPSFDQFRDGSFFSLLNCLTTVLGGTAPGDPQKHAFRTMRLTAMLAQDPRLN